MDLMGKPSVVFEELTVMNKNEWNICDSKLKDMATDSEVNYSDKYQRKVCTANLNNYIVLTNYKAVKRPDGRCYHIITVNMKYCNDHALFADLRDTCFNDKVGYAFYNYFMELDTDDFNSLDIPNRTAKLDMVTDLLSPIEKFLKFEFLLSNIPIKLKIKEPYSKYEKYCGDNGLHLETLTEFRSDMKQYGFDSKVINGYNCFRMPIDKLKSIAEKRKWLHDLDKDVADDDTDGEDFNKGVDLLDKSVDVRAEYNKLLRKYNELLAQRKGIRDLLTTDDEREWLQDEDYDDDDDEDLLVVVKKTSRKKQKHLITEEIDDCIDEVLQFGYM